MKKVRITFQGKTYIVDVEQIPLQGSRMKSLYLLDEMKDKSRNECYSFFFNYTNQQLINGSVLLWKNENDLELNDEGRAIFCEDLKKTFCVENSIIKLVDIKKIYLKNIRKIELKNCVLFNDVFINSNELICDIRIENCFVFGKICIRGGSAPCSVDIYKSAIDKLEMSKEMKGVKLSQTSLGSFVLNEAKITEAEFFWVNIESLQMYSSQILNVSKVQLDICISDPLELEKDYVWNKFPIDALSPDLTRKEKKERSIESANAVLDFIEKNNSVKNVSSTSKVIYLKNKIELRTLIGKIAYVLIGGMIKSLVIVAWYIGLIVLFGAIFHFLLDQPFADKVDNSWVNSLYFSAITMTTVGYGDIEPVGYARIWAAIEGVLGVFLGGAFLIALTRKYFSRET